MFTRRTFVSLTALPVATYVAGLSEASAARRAGAEIEQVEHENCSFLHGAREEFAASLANGDSQSQTVRSLVCPLCQQQFRLSLSHGTVIVAPA